MRCSFWANIWLKKCVQLIVSKTNAEGDNVRRCYHTLETSVRNINWLGYSFLKLSTRWPSLHATGEDHECTKIRGTKKGNFQRALPCCSQWWRLEARAKSSTWIRIIQHSLWAFSKANKKKLFVYKYDSTATQTRSSQATIRSSPLLLTVTCLFLVTWGLEVCCLRRQEIL